MSLNNDINELHMKLTEVMSQQDKKTKKIIFDNIFKEYLKVPLVGNRLQQCKHKKDYNNIFKEYNELFVEYKNLSAYIDSRCKAVICELHNIFDVRNEKFGIGEDDGEDDGEGDGNLINNIVDDTTASNKIGEHHTENINKGIYI
jgi:hypothetical protein